MLRLASFTLAVAILAAAPAFAAPTVLDFEGATSFSSINEFYNGGTDQIGVKGPNVGASFSGSALALVNDRLGTGVNGDYFLNAPTPGTIMFVAPDSSAVLNVAIGFFGKVSFFYSSTDVVEHAVQVFSGLNGTGDLLGEAPLQVNAQSDGCSDAPFCHWDGVDLSFVGYGRSIVFSVDTSPFAGFDNVAFDVPEPTTGLLLAGGLAGFGLLRRRR